jgi:hypothetical protein
MPPPRIAGEVESAVVALRVAILSTSPGAETAPRPIVAIARRGTFLQDNLPAAKISQRVVYGLRQVTFRANCRSDVKLADGSGARSGADRKTTNSGRASRGIALRVTCRRRTASSEGGKPTSAD